MTDARGTTSRHVLVAVDHNGIITITPETVGVGSGVGVVPAAEATVLVTLEVVGGFVELIADDTSGGGLDGVGDSGDGGDDGRGGRSLRATVLERDDALPWVRLVFGDAVFVAAGRVGGASDAVLRAGADAGADTTADVRVRVEDAPLASDAERLLAGLWVRRAWPTRGTRAPRLDVHMLDGELALLAARCEALFNSDEPAIELLESYFSASAPSARTDVPTGRPTNLTAAELGLSAAALLHDIAPSSTMGDGGEGTGARRGGGEGGLEPDGRELDDATEPIDLAARRALLARVDALRASADLLRIGPFVAEAAAVTAAAVAESVAATGWMHDAPPVVRALDRRAMAASDDSTTDAGTRFVAAGVGVAVTGSGPSAISISVTVPAADALPLDIVAISVQDAGAELGGGDDGRRLVVLDESVARPGADAPASASASGPDDGGTLDGAITIPTESARIEVEVAPPAPAAAVLADETWFAAIGPSLRGAGVEQRSRWRRIGAPLADGTRLKEEIRRALIEG